MARAFADISFTETVKAAQLRYGSRESNRGFELAADPRNLLTQTDANFIALRDSFYQATVSETGWPYVQHRGGPLGFLKVIAADAIAYADFSGNRQYLSVGNINADDRVSLILMDYVNRRRLKIWGRASIVHQEEDPNLLKLLQHQDYTTVIERAVVIHVEAIEWNCPKHITQRFSESEVRDIITPLVAENEQLKVRLSQRE